ncbi:hypothetical protein HUT16_20225 [Kitasatospora sp. NA04385]|uniref:hypothetical protein n=1 Tax=Kitasatospora sp. NA04385 TaxID=2742135 RepID=UPI001591C939|nr:hypothetical protein [Kitasatospora sp. NA04385]QKW21070.1 hypothetical protein HUT16_20225 [Kitasatospora sp. NA04385]
MEPTPRPGRPGVGCLALLLAPVLGFLVETRVLGLIEDTWSDCAGVARQVAHDLTDDPRFDVLSPYAFGYLLLPPAAVLLARCLTRRSPDLLTPALAAACAALLAALTVAAVDLERNLTPPHGFYLPANCPDGRPPWLPGFLPARDSGPPIGSVTGG